MAVGGAGAGLPVVSLSGRLHEGGTRHEAGPQGVPGGGEFFSSLHSKVRCEPIQTGRSNLLK